MSETVAVELLKEAIQRDGPLENDYNTIISAFSDLHKKAFNIEYGVSTPIIDLSYINELLENNWQLFSSTATMQGFCRAKPHGYSGDFEIIEKIYTSSTSQLSKLVKWDRFFHDSGPAKAVRNRCDLLKVLIEITKPRSMISIGCGPALDLIGALAGNSSPPIVDLLDNDANAIQRAKINTQPGSSVQVRDYFLKNAFRFHTDRKYDLVWSSGLFDYLNKKTATFLLSRMRGMLAEGGVVAVGNFSNDNPCRGYLEIICDWYLCHREPSEMRELALATGFEASKIRFDVDESGINLLLIAGV